MNAEYSPYPDNNLDLNTMVVAFDAGIRWHVIPVDIMKSFPIIYDKLTDETEKVVDVSITRCPYTSTVVIYEGKFTNEDKKNGNMTLKNNKTIIQQINGECLDKKPCFVRKWEAYVMTLKNVFNELTDCEYLSNGLDNAVIVQEEDTSDNIVGISYDSSDIEKGIKYIAIVSDDFVKIKEYISQFYLKMTKKNGFMTPSKLDTWMKFYPNSKKINL